MMHKNSNHTNNNHSRDINAHGPPSKKNTILIAVSSVVVIIVISILVYFVMKGKKDLVSIEAAATQVANQAAEQAQSSAQEMLTYKAKAAQSEEVWRKTSTELETLKANNASESRLALSQVTAKEEISNNLRAQLATKEAALNDLRAKLNFREAAIIAANDLAAAQVATIAQANATSALCAEKRLAVENQVISLTAQLKESSDKLALIGQTLSPADQALFIKFKTFTNSQTALYNDSLKLLSEVNGNTALVNSFNTKNTAARTLPELRELLQFCVSTILKFENDSTRIVNMKNSIDLLRPVSVELQDSYNKLEAARITCASRNAMSLSKPYAQARLDAAQASVAKNTLGLNPLNSIGKLYGTGYRQYTSIPITNFSDVGDKCHTACSDDPKCNGFYYSLLPNWNICALMEGEIKYLWEEAAPRGILDKGIWRKIL